MKLAENCDPAFPTTFLMEKLWVWRVVRRHLTRKRLKKKTQNHKASAFKCCCCQTPAYNFRFACWHATNFVCGNFVSSSRLSDEIIIFFNNFSSFPRKIHRTQRCKNGTFCVFFQSFPLDSYLAWIFTKKKLGFMNSQRRRDDIFCSYDFKKTRVGQNWPIPHI